MPVVVVGVVLVDVVVVVVSQSLHVLAQDSKKKSHRLAANNSWHCRKGSLLTLSVHIFDVAIVLVTLVLVVVLVLAIVVKR